MQKNIVRGNDAVVNLRLITRTITMSVTLDCYLLLPNTLLLLLYFVALRMTFYNSITHVTHSRSVPGPNINNEVCSSSILEVIHRFTR